MPKPISPQQKYSGYSPPAHLPMSPVKARSDKLRIGGSDENGRCSAFRDKAYENAETRTIVRLRDTGS